MTSLGQQVLAVLGEQPVPGRYLIGYSGGLDSSVLLHVLARARDSLAAPVVAVHVNHGIQAEAVSWERHCRSSCDAWGIPLVARRVNVDQHHPKGLEAAAREARYGAFRQQMAEGDMLLTAHHLDDQAETLLLRLMRGSGVRGLGAMPRLRRFDPGWHSRPLLTQPRGALESYAREHGFEWITDASNRDDRFDRNYLRHRVLPVLRRRWPAIDRVLGRAAELAREADALISEVVDQDLERMARGNRLDLAAWESLSGERQRAVLRHWLDSLQLPVPDSHRLRELQRQVIAAGEERAPCVSWPGGEVHRYRNGLYASAPLPALDRGTVIALVPGEPAQLPAELGYVQVSGSLTAEVLEIRFRRGRERCRIRDSHRTLKNLFQDLGVPPWLRQRVPLVFADGNLAWVADWYCCGPQAQGLDVAWKPGRGWPLTTDARRPQEGTDKRVYEERGPG
ncbi:MAG: tRNA lysidine(34) synthetase TilS [Pseudomonadota bacterium]